jgi:NADPH-dependent glutamate synthase beta subunit-like oxidoreductase/coenzyme F420-reducing hydrogenase delta subunit/formate hydrogenlyase subunit 6/NADH:ubiquinone oxidoreductase subunit I
MIQNQPVLVRRQLSLSRGVLILGGRPAGLQAALDLADSGINVHLIESSPFLGNGGSTRVPDHLLGAKTLEVAKHPRIRVWTNTRLQSVKLDIECLHVELQQHPRYIDLTKCTGCGDCVEVCPVTVPETERKAIYLMGGRQPGCAVIDKTEKPPCAGVCPGGIHVQGYIALIAQGRFQEALGLIREAIPFPGIIGRICTHPCELNCRRSEIDTPVSIRLLKRFVADWELNDCGKPENRVIPEKSAANDARKVAVIGSGPAGMTVADRLARKGHRITVFEKLPVIAGMLSVGIPAYRLPRQVIDHEYRRIESLGVEIRLNTPVGPGGVHNLDDLFKMGYDAVCLAIGAHKSLSPGIPGEELHGVIQGLEFLKTINLSQRLDTAAYQAALKRLLPFANHTRAVVLGGGNTAMDVARTLKRIGARDVRIAYRRTRAEMPALKEEIDDAEQEGIAMEYLTAPCRIIGDSESKVIGLECMRMKLGEPDESGRCRPVPIGGSEYTMPVELVVLAIGQVPDIKSLQTDNWIAMTRDQRIRVNRSAFATDRRGVFATGDAVTRDQMSAIEAIGMGKKAAAEIDAYLSGKSTLEHSDDFKEIPIARREMSDSERLPKPRIPVAKLSMENRLSSFAEIELGYTKEQAMAEAQRCLVCGPCSECLACVKACEPEAIVFNNPTTLMDLEVESIICADDQAHTLNDLPETSKRVYRIAAQDALMGSAAAAHVMSRLTPMQSVPPSGTFETPPADDVRMGVFICQCGHFISDIVDTEALCKRAATWPTVVHAEVLPFSCTVAAQATIQKKVRQLHLNRITLGACVCCSLDQVCYSCTYQRVRCKANLGLFEFRENNSQPGGLLKSGYLPPSAVEFVNIREQCAWVHRENPKEATSKAMALVSAAVAKNRTASGKLLQYRPSGRSALILGSGRAAQTCRDFLHVLGVAVLNLADPPAHIRRVDGRYCVTQNGEEWTAAGMVLAPCDSAEADRLRQAFGDTAYQPRSGLIRPELETTRPGVYYCDPTLDHSVAGAAAAARVCAWLGRCSKIPESHIAVVTPHRCRACNTCVEICEFGAPQLMGTEPNRVAWIDPLICQGCGSCAAQCPSGAIVAGYATDTQLEKMLDAIWDQQDRMDPKQIVLVFTCNWNPYSGLERAGVERLSYSAQIYPMRVMCLGRLRPGIILKAFERGAHGVLLLGCPQDECRYEFGGRRAEETFAVARDLVRTMGYPDRCLKLERVAVGDGKAWVNRIQTFVAGLNRNQGQ